MKINIETPTKLCGYANKAVTSWKLTYMGKADEDGTYHYILTDKENNRIKIRVEIHSQTQQIYHPEVFEPLETKIEYVKIHCKDLNVPQKRGCTKFIRVEEFKDMRRVFNTLHEAGRHLLQ
jgi:hypothetical protein